MFQGLFMSSVACSSMVHSFLYLSWACIQNHLQLITMHSTIKWTTGVELVYCISRSDFNFHWEGLFFLGGGVTVETEEDSWWCVGMRGEDEGGKKVRCEKIAWGKEMNWLRENRSPQDGALGCCIVLIFMLQTHSSTNWKFAWLIMHENFSPLTPPPPLFPPPQKNELGSFFSRETQNQNRCIVMLIIFTAAVMCSQPCVDLFVGKWPSPPQLFGECGHKGQV